MSRKESMTARIQRLESELQTVERNLDRYKDLFDQIAKYLGVERNYSYNTYDVLMELGELKQKAENKSSLEAEVARLTHLLSDATANAEVVKAKKEVLENGDMRHERRMY